MVLNGELDFGDTCLVFCSTRGRTDYVVRELRQARTVEWCDGLHSGKEQWVRDATLEKFRRHTANGNQRAVLVATDVAARGLDIPGVALVVVYDLNGWHGELNIDSYVHRIGRTGRAGKMGRAFTFVETKDRGVPDLVKLLKDAGQRIPEALQELEVDERVEQGSKDKKRDKSTGSKKREKAGLNTDDLEWVEGYDDEDEEWDYDKEGKVRNRDKAKGKGKGKGK